MDKPEHSPFRRLAATANYLDIHFPAKEICRDMVNPKAGSVAKLKRLARYLVGHPRLVWVFNEEDGLGSEEHEEYIDVYTDSNWVGCVGSRRAAES